jgi:hypothetical protein
VAAQLSRFPRDRRVSVVVRASGTNGQLEIDDSFVIITRHGARAVLNHGLKGEKRIPLASVSGIQFKKAGLTAGYLQLTVPGGNESRGGVFAAGNDENTVQFNARQQKDFEVARSHIESAMRAASAPRVTSSPAASPADELAKLAALLKDGLLTQDEFDGAKARLLRDM